MGWTPRDRLSCQHELPKSARLAGWEAVLGQEQLQTQLSDGLCQGAESPRLCPQPGHGVFPSCESNRRCFTQSSASLLPMYTPHVEGAVCASAPHLGTSQMGPCPVSSPGGSGTVWHCALKPPWSLWVGTAPAAPGGAPGPVLWQLPPDRGFAASWGEWGQRQPWGGGWWGNMEHSQGPQ